MTLHYDRKKHLYHLDGRRLLSNTEILELAGVSDFSHVDPAHLHAAAEIGTAVHDATWLLDRRKPWFTTHGHVEGYVKAWMRFKKEFQFKAIYREHPLCCPILGVATCIDAYGESKFGLITVQIKTTTAIHAEVSLQTAFEEYAAVLAQFKRHLPASSKNRFAVNLKPDGTYIPARFDDPGDLGVFIGAANLVKWKLAHGVI